MIAYRPEPLTDFADENARRPFLEALRATAGLVGREYPLIIGGEAIDTKEKIRSLNPSNPDTVVGTVAKADTELAEKAIACADAVFPEWAALGLEKRADFLFKAAAVMRRRKHEFSAWLLLEAGKSRGEADADTAEAIDFLEYYARQALHLEKRGEQELTGLPGERNRLDYIPLGVGIVIPPWNFPLAILVGMTAASIVAGNTVVLKPSSLTPVVAYRFVELLNSIGLPPGVVNYLPGSGNEIGDYLVQHPRTRFIAFTGSREVGVRIQELVAKVQPGQIWLKRFIGEMGGKDAIIVDRDANLEAAAQGIVQSAFGYSGQKCSACSRVIAHQDIYGKLLDLCAELTGRMAIGDVRDPGNYTGPVIDQHAFDNIMQYIAVARQEGRIITGGTRGYGNGYFIKPTLVADVDPQARIMREEIFGPVLAFAKCSNFQGALAIANNTEFGLTGSVYTSNREHIEQARRQFHVGNLYINRKCTGAVVGAHPFGGFNMSGTDSKAGGPDYLLLFTQAKLTSEQL